MRFCFEFIHVGIIAWFVAYLRRCQVQMPIINKSYLGKSNPGNIKNMGAGFSILHEFYISTEPVSNSGNRINLAIDLLKISVGILSFTKMFRLIVPFPFAGLCLLVSYMIY